MLKNLPDQFGAFVISVMVTAGFIAALAYTMIHGVQDNPTLQNLVGSLTTAFSMVVGYWIGSSVSSRNKDDTIATQAAAIKAEPVLEPAAPKAPTAASGAVAALLAITLAGSMLLGSGGHLWAADVASKPLVEAKATLNCGLPHPDPGCGSSSSGAFTPLDDQVTAAIVADLAAAITEANKPPVLASEVACFTKLHDDLASFGPDPSGAGLFTLYVDLIRKQAALADLQTDACLAVCGRASQIVAVPILSKIIPSNLVPNVCQLAKLISN